MPRKSSMARSADKKPKPKATTQMDTVAMLPRKKATPLPKATNNSNGIPLLKADTPSLTKPYINKNEKIRKKYIDKKSKSI